jgi:coproporphyrinogen III oxidase-like Fe-S oxidoreductase
MSMLKLPVLIDFQQKAGELVLSIASCLTIILENALNWCREKCGYCNFDNHCNVSPTDLHAFLGVKNFTNVVRMCAECL